MPLTDHASAITHIDSADPPMLFLHARDDNTVPWPQSRDMHRAMLKAGVKSERVQLEIFTQVGHGPQDSVPERGLARNLQLLLILSLCIFYLVQSLSSWEQPTLSALQELDGYRILTGSLLLSLIAYQWYLPYLRLMGKLAATASRWHSYSGLVAPVLLYLHSISMGFAYTTALASLFVFNTLVGAMDKSLISKLAWRQNFHRVWLSIHVPASCGVTVIALIHMVYALAYS